MELTNFISIQGSYSELQLSLFRNNSCLQTIIENNKRASKFLIPIIKKILINNDLQFSDISFFCTDQGPGAFTSLRVIISTLNGIGYASKIPLIGINGLQALSEEVFIKNDFKKFNILITLLNAYNQEVYFLINKITDQNNLEEISISNNYNYEKIDKFIKIINEKFNSKKIIFTGNGSILYQNLIKKNLKNITFYNQEVCSSEQIGKMALKKWNKQSSKIFKLMPLYLKSQNFAIKN